MFRWLFAGVMTLALGAGSAFGDPPNAPTAPELTEAEREALLARRNEIWEQYQKLYAEEKFVEAIQAAEDMLAVEHRIYGEMHPDIDGSYVLIGFLREKQDDFAGARKAREKSLELRLQLLDDDHWAVTDARMALKNVDLLARLTPEERQSLKEAQERHDLGDERYGEGAYREAAALAEKALEIRIRLLGEKHPKTVESLYDLGVDCVWLGEYDRAESLLQRSLAVYREVLGDHHPETATGLQALGFLYCTLGDYKSAQSLYEESLAIRRETRGEIHEDVATVLYNLAELHRDLGELAKVEPLLRQSLAIYRELYGENSYGAAQALNSLGGLYKSMGDYAKAEPLYRESLAMHRELEGANSSGIAACLNNLASLYEALGDMEKAEPLYLESLDMTREMFGDKHPTTAVFVSNVGAFYMKAGQYENAEPLFKIALTVRRDTLGPSHPDTALSLNNLADLYIHQGEYESAEPLGQEALTRIRAALGPTHPEVAKYLCNLARLYDLVGDSAKAEPLIAEAFEIVAQAAELTASIQSERQQLRMAVQSRTFLDGYLSIADREASDPAELYRAVLRTKGAALARQSNFEMGESADEFLELQQVCTRLATLAFSIPDPAEQETRMSQIRELTERKEALEAQLTRERAEFRAQKEMRDLTVARLQSCLPDGTALVDFLEYRLYAPPPGRNGDHVSERRCAAFVIRPKEAIVRIELGTAAAISELIEQWRLGHGRGEAGTAAGRELRRLIWEPLEASLAGVPTVLVSPDGVLTRLPLAALPGRDAGQYLIEDVAIVVIPTPQLLPELVRDSREAGEPSMLLIGDVDYSGDAAPASDALAFASLPGSGAEIDAIRDVFAANFPNQEAETLRQAAATETAFRELAIKSRYLHIATHGFFAPPEMLSALAPQAGEMSLLGMQEVVGTHPGLLTGLAFAGANGRKDDAQDDGILRAIELAGLDLRGVDLTVLSACETGLGEVAAGEGVLGLQRAFQAAGARSTITSLWQVPDAATSLLMQRFYENLWAYKMGRLDSLREAQIWLLRQPKTDLIAQAATRGLTLLPPEEDSESSTLPPYYWAAFVLSGDWR